LEKDGVFSILVQNGVPRSREKVREISEDQENEQSGIFGERAASDKRRSAKTYVTAKRKRPRFCSRTRKSRRKQDNRQNRKK
jgi:hypothetical protein